jgi:hypothetical protein
LIYDNFEDIARGAAGCVCVDRRRGVHLLTRPQAEQAAVRILYVPVSEYVPKPAEEINGARWNIPQEGSIAGQEGLNTTKGC